MSVKNGAVGWSEGGSGSKSKNDFLRLKPGSNLIRILTLPHQYSQHRFEPEGGKKYGYRINCSKTDHEKNCPLCAEGNKAKTRWFIGVVDRETGTYKTLDIGYSVFKSIQTLAKGQWGMPDKYDVDIVVDPQGGATGYYFVSPMPQSPLTAADIALQEANPASLLAEKTEAPSPAWVQEKLDKIHAEIEGGTTGSGSKEEKSPSSSKGDEGEEDDFFKNFDKKTA